MKKLFSSESVTEGHPDKVADLISDSIVDACLEQDPNSRVACETAVTTDYVLLLGEITTNAVLDFEKIIKKVDIFEERIAHNWTGKEELESFENEKIFNPHPCWHIRNNLVILWNGDVTLCCADLHGKKVVGNIYHQEIYDIWKGIRLNIAKAQFLGKKRSIELCRKCSIPS